MFKWLMLAIYLVLDIYILWRILYWLKIVVPLFKKKRTQAVIVGIYLSFASSIFWGAFLPRSDIQRLIHRIGNVWIAAFIYMLFFIFLADLFILVLKLINTKKELTVFKKMRYTYLIGVVVVSLSVLFTVYGTVHARKMYTTRYTVNVDKKVKGISNLKIVLVADLHIGYSIGESDMKKMTDRINAEKPDLILYGGDIFDNDFDAVKNPDKIAGILKNVKAKYGSYAVFGNHDVTETLVGGFSVASKHLAFRDKRMESFLKKADISVLLDDTITIGDGQIYLIGRLDREKAGDGTSDRMSIQNLTKDLDKDKVILLLEHEPANLDGIADCGVDVMLCGHTHAGQFFPLTIAQPFAWENPCGVLKVDNMYSVVTSGVGIYGPAVRVGTKSEVLSLNVKFK